MVESQQGKCDKNPCYWQSTCSVKRGEDTMDVKTLSAARWQHFWQGGEPQSRKHTESVTVQIFWCGVKQNGYKQWTSYLLKIALWKN